MKAPRFPTVCTPVLLFLLLAAFPAAGQAVDSVDLASLIGLTPAEALQRLGPPSELSAARGPEPWQDDVVFYYPQHLYLFWYQNRVWQARVDMRYRGKILAFGMGAGRGEVRSALGEPLKEFPDSLVYQLEDRGYPVRLRLYFEEDRLVDVYCYRGDL